MEMNTTMRINHPARTTNTALLSGRSPGDISLYIVHTDIGRLGKLAVGEHRRK
jgi:hypothetical protein